MGVRVARLGLVQFPVERGGHIDGLALGRFGLGGRFGRLAPFFLGLGRRLGGQATLFGFLLAALLGFGFPLFEFTLPAGALLGVTLLGLGATSFLFDRRGADEVDEQDATDHRQHHERADDQGLQRVGRHK